MDRGIFLVGADRCLVVRIMTWGWISIIVAVSTFQLLCKSSNYVLAQDGVELLSPDNGQLEYTVSSPSFSWAPYNDATKYKFVLAKDASFVSVVDLAEVAGTAYEYSGTLDYSTTYFWKVMAIEPVPSEFSATFSFRSEAAPLPPASSGATNITANEARLNGSLTGLGAGEKALVSFEWGTTHGEPYPNETTPQEMDAPGSFHFDLSGLTPGQTYYYRSKVVVGEDISYGSEVSFQAGLQSGGDNSFSFGGLDWPVIAAIGGGGALLVVLLIILARPRAQAGMGAQRGGIGQQQPGAQQLFTCPGCGAAIAFGSNPCPNCGMGLNWGSPQAFVCPNCGTGVNAGSKFCPNCGTRLGGRM